MVRTNGIVLVVGVDLVLGPMITLTVFQLQEVAR
jgi:hypothetical protein